MKPKTAAKGVLVLGLAGIFAYGAGHERNVSDTPQADRPECYLVTEGDRNLGQIAGWLVLADSPDRAGEIQLIIDGFPGDPDVIHLGDIVPIPSEVKPHLNPDASTFACEQ